MLNFTRIPAPRVTLVDPQTGVVSNEWFRFFNNLYSIIYAATGNVTPGTYGSATVVPQITVDAFGAITAITDVTIALDASQIVSGTIASARISGSYTGITGVGTLTAGTWNATAITTPYGGTGLSSYTAGDTLYYASGSALTKLAIGVSTYINTSSGTAPQWTDPTTITIGKATNLVGGAANRIAYQTAADTTDFIVAPTIANTYLEWSGTAFQWTANPLGTVTSVSVVSANGLAGTVATATTTPAITLSTTVTGLLKGNGTAISAASSGTDYAPATSGTSILYGNGAGGFSNVTIGTGVSFAAGTLSATGSGGTVTSVSGTGTVNGITLTGTVTSSGSLTLGGTLSGIGNSQLTNSTISGVALGGNLFDLTAGTGVSFSVGTTYNGSAAITINATGTGGTVTSVAALTLGTTGTDLSSTVANGTTTPVITLNVPTASSVNRGALSAADWTTFNSKAPGVTFTTGYIPFGQGTTTLNQSANLFWDNTNVRLGIGITSPAATLHLFGGDLIIEDGTSAANTKYIYFYNGGSTRKAYIASENGPSAGGNFTSLLFATNAAGADAVERMRIHSSGGVSIGNTTDPGATNLSVTGNISATNITTTGNTILGNASTDTLNVGNNGLVKDASGNVGVGMTTNYGKVSIANTAASGGLHLSNGTTDTGGYLNSTGTSELMMSGGASYNSYSTPNFVMNAKSTVASGIYFASGVTRFWNNTGLTAGTTFNQTERMRIDSAGNTYVQTGTLWQYAPAPTSKAAVATLTAAEVQTGILNTTGTTYTVTLPTGTALDTAFAGVPTTNIGFDWFVVNTASGTITIAVGASGMTSLGTLTIATGVSAQFRLRRTAANTYVLYRLG